MSKVWKPEEIPLGIYKSDMARMDTLAIGLATRLEQLHDALEQSTWMARQRVGELERLLTQRTTEWLRQLAELQEQKPLFWYRPVCNGEMYEGPVHANSIGGKMLREEKPDEWLPLYAAPVLPQPANPDARDAARYRWLRRGQRYSVVNGIGDDLRAEALDAAVDADIAYINSSNGDKP